MKKNIKQSIINETINLINANDDVSKITIRDICKATGVGTGLINYHFKSKENLIACCVQQIIGDVIQQFNNMCLLLKNKTALERLRMMIKSTCTFLVDNENIARISILTDMQKGAFNDNTNQTLSVYLPIVKAVCPNGTDLLDIKILAYNLIFALQGLFLRTDLAKADLALDFREEKDRDLLVDKVIDSVFSKYL
ncbi:TetR/AcrR family transcriptional regulator [Clostridium sp. 'deep sea']|uniref:TetR/AcrR family transcriptional regulator n=1 Tax=Clostridium sp. 'deep sea' TaxID=2779445 RepID=UPI001896404F|nr:TetR/AcrR family transcriptional regulator [Clostridium sp. 'deep sea']QOR36506.1 TetR/AcrR family transcriptional regulator [Clostridium sp. 'deep sea']